MRNIIKMVLVSVSCIMLASNVNAQELSVVNRSNVNIKALPEYVIITSENTKLLGGINITIDAKRSNYKKELRNLESILQDGDKLRVRNQTDLLNSMSKLGFKYIDAYNANSGTIGGGGGDDINVFGSSSKFRINMVFRKKAKFLNMNSDTKM